MNKEEIAMGILKILSDKLCYISSESLVIEYKKILRELNNDEEMML